MNVQQCDTFPSYLKHCSQSYWLSGGDQEETSMPMASNARQGIIGQAGILEWNLTQTQVRVCRQEAEMHTTVPRLIHLSAPYELQNRPWTSQRQRRLQNCCYCKASRKLPEGGSPGANARGAFLLLRWMAILVSVLVELAPLRVLARFSRESWLTPPIQ